MHVRAIVNPNSSNGRTRVAWPGIAEALNAAIGPLEAVFTDGPLAATERTREALNDGVDLVIAVGGDGTVNEVVNGFFAPPADDGDDVPLRPEAELAVLMSGTGGDFRKTFGFAPDLHGQIQHIARGATRTIDVGRIDYTDHHGRPAARYFANIASFGLSGLVSATVNKASFTKRINGRFAFFLASVRAAIGYKMPRVHLQVDAHEPLELGINTAAICNGRYFGGGMLMAPEAQPDDGLFDVIIMHDMSTLDLLRDPNAIYRGTHIRNPKVISMRGRRICASPLPGPPALLDIDGETPGRLPATFTISPSVLKFRC
jgi:diacylglycerol kinase (ATP)